VHDITERKHAEEALRREQALFKDLVSTIPDNIYFKDRKSRFVCINDAMAKTFGLHSADEAAGKTDFDIFSEEHARQAYEDEQRIMSTGEPLIGLVEKETWPDGHVTWVSTTNVPRRDANGTVIGLVGISRDVTASKQDEERIHEQAALLGIAHDFNSLLAEIHRHAASALAGLPPEAPARDGLQEIERTLTRAGELCQQMLAPAPAPRACPKPT
jgi:PAS domain S-box-containing protein